MIKMRFFSHFEALIKAFDFETLSLSSSKVDHRVSSSPFCSPVYSLCVLLSSCHGNVYAVIVPNFQLTPFPTSFFLWLFTFFRRNFSTMIGDGNDGGGTSNNSRERGTKMRTKKKWLRRLERRSHPLSKIYQDFVVLRQSVQFVMVYIPRKSKQANKYKCEKNKSTKSKAVLTNSANKSL